MACGHIERANYGRPVVPHTKKKKKNLFHSLNLGHGNGIGKITLASSCVSKSNSVVELFASLLVCDVQSLSRAYIVWTT